MNRDKISLPMEHYESPQSLIHDNELEMKDKLSALRNWKDSVKQVLECENEGMGSTGSLTKIKDIDSAIEEVKSSVKS